jgi:predicted porin
MQKKVLAAVIGGLLAVPAAVFADSANVNISGRVAVGVEMYKLSGGNPPNVLGYSTEQRVSDQSSSLIFSGSEDLGGGMKAWFQIDERFAPDLGTLAATGNTQAGLAGGWGKLAIGRQDLHYNELARLDAPRAGSLQDIISMGPVSQVNGTTVAIGSRSSNVIYWDSADLGGVTIRVGYSTNPGANEGTGVGNQSKDGALTAAVRYAAGPISAGASIWDWKAEGTADSTLGGFLGDQKSNRAWFGWNAAGLKVGFGVDSSEVRVTAGAPMTKRTALLLPVSFSFGADSVYATIAKMGKTSGGAAGTDHTDTDAQAMMLGWDHALSKRTFVGAFYAKIDNKARATYDLFALAANGATATAAGEDATQLYLGFTHLY